MRLHFSLLPLALLMVGATLSAEQRPELSRNARLAQIGPETAVTTSDTNLPAQWQRECSANVPAHRTIATFAGTKHRATHYPAGDFRFVRAAGRGRADLER